MCDEARRAGGARRARGLRVAIALLCAGAATALAGVAGCGRAPTTGPGEIHWDRTTCERCQMVISERRHAVQTRAFGDARTHAFDDLGCALLWLDERADAHGGVAAGTDAGADGALAPRYEVWVRDPVSDRWIDGHSARYAPGLSTPMDYGFASAVDGIPLAEVRERIARAERERRRDRAGARAGGGRGG